jgi:hypothetical protein
MPTNYLFYLILIFLQNLDKVSLRVKGTGAAKIKYFLRLNVYIY